MTKIAVASDQNTVTQHFGHCKNFWLFESQEGQIVAAESIPNPGHRPGFLPNFLHDLGVNVIISGGMGQGAVEIFEEKGIAVVVGASGDARQAAEACLSGELKSTGAACTEHRHDS